MPDQQRDPADRVAGDSHGQWGAATPADPFARRVEQLAGQIAAMRRHADRLRRHVDGDAHDRHDPHAPLRADPVPADLPSSRVLDDLLEALESLGVAEEELRQQHEELAAAYAALDAERARYRDLFEVAPVAYVVTGADGMVRDANREAGRLLGVNPEELWRKPLAAYVAADDRREFRATLERLAATETPAAETTLRFQPRGRALVETAVSATATTDHDARGMRVVRWVLRDVTAEREAQRQVRRLNAELERRVEERTHELAIRTTEVEAANRAKTAFLATMSHELRTPLNAVIGYADLLDSDVGGPLTATQRAYVERLRASGLHLAILVEDVLDVAKIEAGQMALRTVHRPVHTAVDAAIALVRPQAAAKLVEVHHECDADPEHLYAGDEARVRQILANLLANAVKFTPSSGRVTVRCGVSGQAPPDGEVVGAGPWAWISVADTGIGIPADRIAAVFEPFVQAETGYARTHGGTGLGLTISRRLARLMGGDVVARSEVDRGSEFTLWLPVAAGDGSGGSAARGATTT